MEPISWLIGIALAVAVGHLRGRSYEKKRHNDEIDRLNKRIADLEDDNPANPTA